LSGKQVASLLALAPAMQLGAPLLWAWLADRTQQHARVLSVILSGACLGFAPIIFAKLMGAHPAIPLMASYATYAVFWAGTTSTLDAVTLGRLRADKKLSYGHVRAWGSFGFLSSAVLVGGWLTWRGERSPDRMVPLLATTFLGLAAAVSFSLRGTGEPAPRPRWEDVRRLLREPVFRRLLILAPLHWGAAAPYNQFFGLFGRDHHLSPLGVGLAFATGVLAEVVVLLRFPRFRSLASLRTLMAIAFAGTLVRWLLVAATHDMTTLILLQTFHGLTYGLFWATSIACLQATVAPALRATGQALFVMSMAGVGTLLGSLAAGAIYDATGSITPAFHGAAVVEGLALLLLLRPGATLDTKAAHPVEASPS
jgi:MFS family permease